MTCPLRSRTARLCRSWNDRRTKRPRFTTRLNIANLPIPLRIWILSYICSRVVWARASSRCQWPSATPVSLSVSSPLSSSARFVPTVSTYWSSPLTFCADDCRHLVWDSPMLPKRHSWWGRNLFRNMPGSPSKF